MNSTRVEKNKLTAKGISSFLLGFDLPLKGRVLSVYKRSLNLVFGKEEVLVSVVPDSTGKLPNAILYRNPKRLGIDFNLFDIKQNMKAVLDIDSLSIQEAGTKINFDKATVYSYKNRNQPKLDSWENIYSRSYLCKNRIRRERLESSGLLPLINHSHAIVSGRLIPATELDRRCQKAWVCLAEIFLGLKGQDIEQTKKGLTGLVGLGIGLTPSGDDVLLGLISLLKSVPVQLWIVDRFSRLIGDMARERTNRISAAYLIHASRGEVSERVGKFVMAILSGPNNALFDELMNMLHYGHTSGIEIVFGVLLGVDWLCYSKLGIENRTSYQEIAL